MAATPSPDLPPASEPFTADTALHRWPSGSRRCEVIKGALVFTPFHAFDERDATAARRTYSGRQVEIVDSVLVVWPSTGRTFDL